MRPLFLILALALPTVARADDNSHPPDEAIRQIKEKAAAEMEALRKEDAAEKRELQSLLDGGALRDDARAEALIDEIMLNGSRAAALQLRYAKELRRLVSPAQFAKIVVDQR